MVRAKTEDILKYIASIAIIFGILIYTGVIMLPTFLGAIVPTDPTIDSVEWIATGGFGESGAEGRINTLSFAGVLIEEQFMGDGVHYVVDGSEVFISNPTNYKNFYNTGLVDLIVYHCSPTTYPEGVYPDGRNSCHAEAGSSIIKNLKP